MCIKHFPAITAAEALKDFMICCITIVTNDQITRFKSKMGRDGGPKKEREEII